MVRVGQHIHISVPATSANLGPGFDTLGVALDWCNNFDFIIEQQGVHIEGCDSRFCNTDNLTYRSFCRAAEYIGMKFSGLRIIHDCTIPVARGLGSSATCIVAGVTAAMRFAGKRENVQTILDIATSIEGHPDNIAPAVCGGWCVSKLIDNHVHVLPIQVKNNYNMLALIPPFTLSTEQARRVLPKKVSMADAVSNIANVSWLIAALSNGADNVLSHGFNDNLHQPYRSTLIEGYDSIMSVLQSHKSVLGAYLSGAGPTIMAITPPVTDITDLVNTISSQHPQWKLKCLSPLHKTN